MGIIQFKEVNCKSCYKCIRSCPVKAISFKNDHAQIIEDECILCGKCIHVCPQNAKSVMDEVDKVKGFIDRKLKVYASIAPSFAAAFDISDEMHIYDVFKKLGFTYVEETAIGAAAITPDYRALLKKKEMKNIITTACPTIVNLIEKHYPELIDQVAPVVSPMIAHGRMLKEKYGSRIKVVFIGPCLSKKDEAAQIQFDKAIDAVITFEEFEKWINEKELSFDNQDQIYEEDDLHRLNTRYYPAPGGLIKALGSTKEFNYKFVKFDGIDRCIEILEQIKSGNVTNYFIEMNSCVGACLGGPCMNSQNSGFLEMRDKLVSYINKSSLKINSAFALDTKVSFINQIYDRSKKRGTIAEENIITILNKIGKYSKEDELNCGACGYNTCREKAAAVFNGKADLKMCLPYIRQRAESISNVLINSSPNAIFAMDEDFNISEVNNAARKMFNLDNDELQSKKMFEIIDCPDIFIVNETKEDIYNNKYFYKEYNITVEQSILYLKENRMFMIIMKDITQDENKKQQLHKVRCETVDIAQKVIEKQMIVAQEIASLLGETTAQTKVALTKLKNSVQSEIGDNI